MYFLLILGRLRGVVYGVVYGVKLSSMKILRPVLKVIVINMYLSVLTERDVSVVKAELEVWKVMMARTSPVLKSALECLGKYDQNLYPNIYRLL